MSAFVKPIRYAPVFVGRTEEDEKIVLYNVIGNENSLHIKRPDGELWALSRGAEVEMAFDPFEDKMQLSVRSPEWTGNAIGTRHDLLQEEPIR